MSREPIVPTQDALVHDSCVLVGKDTFEAIRRLGVVMIDASVEVLVVDQCFVV